MNEKLSDSFSETRSQTSQKKILHFSDGTLEVDDDVEHSEVDSPCRDPVDPKQLTWVPWMWYQTITAGSKTLQVCDYLGESLASFFGITTPKYQFEINEYNKMKKAEEEAQREKDLELGSWTNKIVTDTDMKDPISNEADMLRKEVDKGSVNTAAPKY